MKGEAPSDFSQRQTARTTSGSRSIPRLPAVTAILFPLSFAGGIRKAARDCCTAARTSLIAATLGALRWSANIGGRGTWTSFFITIADYQIGVASGAMGSQSCGQASARDAMRFEAGSKLTGVPSKYDWFAIW